jgi:peptide deformylase
MAKLKIVTHPSAWLRKTSGPVKKKFIRMPELQQLVADMIETMRVEDGIGLAAPQVGKNLRVIVVLDGEKPLVFINPRLYRKSWRKLEVEEGCLSVPGVWGKVKRHHAVSVVAFDAKGSRIRKRARGMLAVVLQHEVDHLDGILFIDKAKDLKESKM